MKNHRKEELFKFKRIIEEKRIIDDMSSVMITLTIQESLNLAKQ